MMIAVAMLLPTNESPCPADPSTCPSKDENTREIVANLRCDDGRLCSTSDKLPEVRRCYRVSRLETTPDPAWNRGRRLV